MVVLVLLFMVDFGQALDFKKEFGKLKNSVAKQGKKIEKKVEHVVKKGTKKVENAASKFKKKLEKTFSKEVKAEVEQIKEIQEQVDHNQPLTQEQVQKLEKSLQKTFDKVVASNIINEAQVQKLKEDVPLVLSQMNTTAGKVNEEWAKRKESQGKILELLERYPDLRKEYQDMVKKVVQMVQEGASSESIQTEIDTRMKSIISKIPEDEETIRFFEELEERAQDLENQASFDMEQYKEDVQTFVNKYSNEYKLRTPEEREEFVNYVIASNTKLDKLLKRVEDQKIVKRLIDRFDKKVDKVFKNNETASYEEVMHELDEEIEKIETQQLAHEYNADIALEAPYYLGPRQQFTFTVEDVMVEKRADIDFFEFVKVKMENGYYCEDEDDYEDMDDEDCYVPSEDEGKIVASGDTIYGVAPTRESTFYYETQLKYTSFRAGGETKIYDTSLVLRVGDGDEFSIRPVLVFAIGALSILAIILLGLLFLRRCLRRNVLTYEDFDGEVQFERKSVEGPPSDLERTASDSQ